MYNYNKLKGLIKQYFSTQANFAKFLEIGTTTLNSRLNGETYFTQEEIDKCIKVFKLNTVEEIEETFFYKGITENRKNTKGE